MTTENWNDKEFVLERVKQNGLALEFASEELRNDLEVVIEAIKQDLNAINFASPEVIKAMREFVGRKMKEEIKAAWIIFFGGLILAIGVYFFQHLKYYGYGKISWTIILIGALVFGYGLYRDLR